MKNSVVLVTGGAKGIGKGICDYLSNKNMIVVAVDIDEDAGFELVAANPKIRFKQADVTSESEMAAVIHEIHEQFGRIDGVVNNAAIANPYNTPLEDLDIYDWNKVISVNLTAPMIVTKLCLPMLRTNHGAVVNIASTCAVQSEPNTEAYCASKGGVVSLTHAMATSVGPDVRINCVSPGWIDTTNEELRAIDHSQHPAGRVGNVEDIAAMVFFLLSKESGFVTGQNFVIDGGMTKKMIYAE